MSGEDKKDNSYNEEVRKLLFYLEKYSTDKNSDVSEDKTPYRKSAPLLLGHYLTELSKVNSETFSYLTEDKKNALKEIIKKTLALILMQQLHNYMNESRKNVEEWNYKAELCRHYLRLLQKELSTPPIDPAASPVKFLGISIARWLVNMFAVTPNEPGKTLIEWLTLLNERRMYWIWGGGLLPLVLSAVPQDLGHTLQARIDVNSPNEGAGYLSWSLYYVRFGLNLFLILQYTLPSDDLTTEEKNLKWYGRALIQLQQRKYQLANDLAWGTINLVTFFWAKGTGSSAYIGNMLIVGLLLFDILVTAYRYREESKQHEREITALKEKINVLDEKITANNNQQELFKLKRQHQEFTRIKEKKETDWRYKRYGIINDLLYSSGLTIGWIIMGGVLFPPGGALVASQAALTTMGVAGGGFAFVLTIAYQVATGLIEISKTKHTLKENEKIISALIEEYKRPGNGDNEAYKKYLYLEIRSLQTQNRYQLELIRHQQIKLIVTSVIDALIPGLIFAGLVFAPFGGLAVMAAGLALVLLNKFISNVVFSKNAPKMGDLPKFGDVDYKQFANNPEDDVNKNRTNQYKLFAHRHKSKPATKSSNKVMDQTGEKKDDQVSLLGPNASSA